MTNYDVIIVERKTAEYTVINSFVEKIARNREKTRETTRNKENKKENKSKRKKNCTITTKEKEALEK